MPCDSANPAYSSAMAIAQEPCRISNCSSYLLSIANRRSSSTRRCQMTSRGPRVSPDSRTLSIYDTFEPRPEDKLNLRVIMMGVPVIWIMAAMQAVTTVDTHRNVRMLRTLEEQLFLQLVHERRLAVRHA